jgi:CRISPR-associated protein Csh1
VYGFVNTYNFYTVDKPGFVTGGFKQQDAWKNYPVCLQCACNLELGKRYLNENLNFRFYGFKYLLIPKFFNNERMEEVLDILEGDLADRADKFIKAGFKQEYINRLTDAENEIFELFSRKEDYVSFDLVFYREKQAAFNILLHVEDVLPSRFRKLFETKARLDEIDIFKREVSSKDGKRLLIFNFGVLRNFFPYESKTRSFDEHFLDLVGKIFSLKPIDYHFVVRAIVKKLRSGYVDSPQVRLDCLSGYLLLNYLADLKILSKGGERMEIKPIADLQGAFWTEDMDVLGKVDAFFQAHIGFFDLAAKKTCFLIGVLVQMLLDIQQLKYKTSKPPFRSKLQGLRLTENIVKRLSYAAQNKLEEYDKNYYRKLEALIAQYMIAAGPKWSCTNDEISFHFTLGMNMAGLFKSRKDEEGDEQSDE